MPEPIIPGGYYIKARAIQESEIMRQPPHVREVWDYLLMNANHSDKKYGGHEVKRGQLFRTYSQIREDLSWRVGWRKEMYSENHMKKAMKFLRESLMVTTKKAPGGVLITVLNYDKYQDPKSYERTKEGANERTNAEPMRNQGVPYNKNGRKEEWNNLLTTLSGHPDEGGAGGNKFGGGSYSVDSFVFGAIGHVPGIGESIQAKKRTGEVKSEKGKAHALPGQLTLPIQSQKTGQNGTGHETGGEVAVGSKSSSGSSEKTKNGAKNRTLEIEQVIAYLNEKTGRRYSAKSQAAKKHIGARLNEGYMIEDFAAVVDLKFSQWGNDQYWQKFIRPSTLFAGKFDEYLNEAPAKQKKSVVPDVIKTAGRALVKCSSCQEHKRNGGCPNEDLSGPIDCTQFY